MFTTPLDRGCFGVITTSAHARKHALHTSVCCCCCWCCCCCCCECAASYVYVHAYMWIETRKGTRIRDFWGVTATEHFGGGVCTRIRDFWGVTATEGFVRGFGISGGFDGNGRVCTRIRCMAIVAVVLALAGAESPALLHRRLEKLAAPPLPSPSPPPPPLPPHVAYGPEPGGSSATADWHRTLSNAHACLSVRPEAHGPHARSAV